MVHLFQLVKWTILVFEIKRDSGIMKMIIIAIITIFIITTIIITSYSDLALCTGNPF